MKRKLMFITSAAIIIALAITGTVLAAGETGTSVEAANGTGNGRNVERGTGQRFAIQADQYETEEEFHAAVLAQKLALIDAKEADGSLSAEDAETIRTHLTSCDGTCETEGENPNRPEDGWGIFGNKGTGNKGMGNRGAGERAEDCEEGTPLQDGSGNENGQRNKGGRNN